MWGHYGPGPHPASQLAARPTSPTLTQIDGSRGAAVWRPPGGAGSSSYEPRLAGQPEAAAQSRAVGEVHGRFERRFTAKLCNARLAVVDAREARVLVSQGGELVKLSLRDGSVRGALRWAA
jgi:hypothetical protein